MSMENVPPLTGIRVIDLTQTAGDRLGLGYSVLLDGLLGMSDAAIDTLEAEGVIARCESVRKREP